MSTKPDSLESWAKSLLQARKVLSDYYADKLSNFNGDSRTLVLQFKPNHFESVSKFDIISILKKQGIGIDYVRPVIHRKEWIVSLKEDIGLVELSTSAGAGGYNSKYAWGSKDEEDKDGKIQRKFMPTIAIGENVEDKFAGRMKILIKKFIEAKKNNDKKNMVKLRDAAWSSFYHINNTTKLGRERLAKIIGEDNKTIDGRYVGYSGYPDLYEDVQREYFVIKGHAATSQSFKTIQSAAKYWKFWVIAGQGSSMFGDKLGPKVAKVYYEPAGKHDLIPIEKTKFASSWKNLINQKDSPQYIFDIMKKYPDNLKTPSFRSDTHGTGIMLTVKSDPKSKNKIVDYLKSKSAQFNEVKGNNKPDSKIHNYLVTYIKASIDESKKTNESVRYPLLKNILKREYVNPGDPKNSKSIVSEKDGYYDFDNKSMGGKYYVYEDDSVYVGCFVPTMKERAIQVLAVESDIDKAKRKVSYHRRKFESFRKKPQLNDEQSSEPSTFKNVMTKLMPPITEDTKHNWQKSVKTLGINSGDIIVLTADVSIFKKGQKVEIVRNKTYDELMLYDYEKTKKVYAVSPEDLKGKFKRIKHGSSNEK